MLRCPCGGATCGRVRAEVPMRRCHVRKSPCRGAHAEAACKVIQYARRFNTQDNSRRQAPGCTRCIRESFFIYVIYVRVACAVAGAGVGAGAGAGGTSRTARATCAACTACTARSTARTARTACIARTSRTARTARTTRATGSTRTAGLPAPPARPGPPAPPARPEAPSARLWQCRESVRMPQVRPLCFVALL